MMTRMEVSFYERVMPNIGRQLEIQNDLKLLELHNGGAIELTEDEVQKLKKRIKEKMKL